MGVYHFMGVGKSVGAVTCAVDYIEKALTCDSYLFKGTGGISHAEKHPGKIEALVLFSSKEVIKDSFKAFEYKNNNKPKAVKFEIESNLKNIWKTYDKDEGRKIFWVEVDIDNFKDCFDKALKVAYRFSQPGKQGKEIWLNLTGGVNSINLALMSMARFTGLSVKHYLLSQRKDYQSEITVPRSVEVGRDADQYFQLLPFIRTAVDSVNFYEILFEIANKSNNKQQVLTSELFYTLQTKRSNFANLTLDAFKKEFMIKLFALGYINYTQIENVYPSNGYNSITESGRQFLDDLSELNDALDLESQLMNKDYNIVEDSKNWDWFSYNPVVL